MTSNKSLSTADEQLNKLFEAHVAHELKTFSEKGLQKLVSNELSYFLEASSADTLNQWIKPQPIKALIKEHVVDNHIPGSIADIAGKMSDTIFTSSFHKQTKFNQILSRQQFEEFVDKAIELKEQRNNGLNKLIDLPIYTDLISGILFQAITHYIYENNMLSKNIPGMSSLLKAGKSMMDKRAPKLGSGIEDSVRTYISSSLELIISESKAFLENSVTDQQLKDSAITLWENIENRPLSDFQKGMNSLDLSEFISLGYDFWLNFRRTDYFKYCYETVVDWFFKEYGKMSIGELMEEFQVTSDKINKECARFAPLLIKGMKKSGYLEAAIRRHLETFYSSNAAKSCLNGA